MRSRTTLRWILGGTLGLAGIFGGPEITCADEVEGAPAGTWFAVSPVVGGDRNELSMPGPRGTTTTATDTAPEYGLFAVMAHPNLVINNFVFFSHVNDTDVWGDLLFANYYMNADALVTPNIGAGYLYHSIKPENEDIKVQVPMLKLGPRVRIPALHLTLSPYLGYAWERIATQHGDQDNDSYLYGAAASWRWRMLDVNVNYYYQDGQEITKDFQTVRGRFIAYLNRSWGVMARVDYMEHMSTKDTSVLFGPVAVF
jgi:hypothetical protein